MPLLRVQDNGKQFFVCEDFLLKLHTTFITRVTALSLAVSCIISLPVQSFALSSDVGIQQTSPFSHLPDPSLFDEEPASPPESGGGEAPPDMEEFLKLEETPPAPTLPTAPAESASPKPTQPAPTLPAATEPEPTEPEETEPLPESRVPRFFQTDYPDVPYGDGTVATSGCSMACMAMIVSALTDQTVTPDNLAKRFRNADGSHIQRMEAIATIYDINYTKTFAMYDVVNALKAGKLVVEMVARPSPFTSTQHLIVLTGITDNGKILVNDPMGTNYQNPALAHALTYGFDPGYLSYGFSGAWIFEPMEIPDNVQSNYPDMQLSQDDRDILAKMVWLEARGEPFKGQQAVAEVVLNRLISDEFPGKTLRAIVFAEDQFTTAKFIADTTADELQYKAVDMALSGPNVLPTNVFYFARAAKTRDFWGRIGRHVFSYTNS